MGVGDIGLVLAGGGGKGSWQVGVFKAMEKLGLWDRIAWVAGTSVGALNGALAIQGTLEIAEMVWLDISRDKILSNVSEPSRTGPQGFFTRAGLMEIMDRHLDFTRLESSSIKGWACTARLPDMKPCYHSLNEGGAGLIKKALLATSALPLIFPPEELAGSFHVDGGLAEDLPFTPLTTRGVRKIISLAFTPEIPKQAFLPPGVAVLPVFPRQSVGTGMEALLDFDPFPARWRIHRGYEDGMKMLENWRKYFHD